ncbi:MAG: GGDEF domain-containing protein [Candidatus Competibacteraceae bacterium]|nr:GGDEF domain-containing protein [Candidatus Competibacteraceae bacterium]
MNTRSAEASLLESEEQVLETAQAALHNKTLGSCAAPFTELTRQYARLLRHIRHLIRVSDRMQEELNRLNEQLRQSEDKYRSLFENAIEGIFIAQLHGGLLCINPAMAHILGYTTPEKFLQAHQGGEQWPFVDHQDKERLFNILEEYGRVKYLQARMLCQDGQILWVEINAQAHPPDARYANAWVEGTLSDITERKKMLEELRHLAITDSLTSLYNRRHFLELCKQELRRASRYRLATGLLVLDADRFKTINDTHGHALGDEVLRIIGRLCRAQLREVDVIGRIGGEEFAILLPQTGFPATCKIAERLRSAIEQTALPLANGGTLRFTVSVGGCVLANGRLDIRELFKVADQALYVAKNKGRNRVEVYPADPASGDDATQPQ